MKNFLSTLHSWILAVSLLLLWGCAQPADEARQNETTTHTTSPASETEVLEQADPPALDLSRGSLDELATESIELEDEETLLEDMFDGTEDKRTKLSGKMLTDEEATNLEDRMDGVEIKLEMKTD